MSHATLPHPDPATGPRTGPVLTPCQTHPEPDLWHPDRERPHYGQRLIEVRELCAACPIQAACLQYAIDTRQRWGIWGGLGRHERQRLAKARQAGPTSTAA